MDITFHAITAEAAQTLTSWRYPAPYDTYNVSIGDEQAALTEMLDARSPWFVAFDADGAPMGYCCFGTAAAVGWQGEPRLWTTDDKTLSIGLGLRPDLTGQHLGLPFFTAIMDFAAEQFAPEAFRLFVLPFNRRAIRVYERAGFQHVCAHVVNAGSTQGLLYLEMRREATRKSGSKNGQ
ncbi:MAG TPA: GNAT family N-acetyltransferase [Ktedonobacterales bacterium]|nr:GNAT family N-acetyltransferase [Ktedonobacterales bacterium]